ncbi:hypothetical protein OROMI_028395 [Orobanche minor]
MINIPVAYIVVTCLLMTGKTANGVIGMNWGRQSVQRLVPSVVVDLLLQNGIRHARIYSTQTDLLEAFSGSGIHLSVGIFNVFLIKNDSQADDWVQKVLPYFGPANIRRVYIGNYVFKHGLNNQTLREAGITTLTLVQKALNKAGYGDQIKASMPHSALILKGNITRPSEAEFKDEIVEDMNKTLRFLLDNNAPFVVYIFPVLDVREHNLDPSFAFPDNKSAHVVKDVNGAVYTNVFDFVYDAIVWALEKLGAGDLEVIVGQVGWPTDGYWGANTSAAERFYKSFLPMVSSNKGTPKRPGRPIDTYLHSLTDETQMPKNVPYSRHWGIYRSNGEPKYKIDLTGQGRDIFPARAKGIMRMPDRWCMFNGKTHDEEKVTRLMKDACNVTDCTCLAAGGSCSRLDYELNVSYVFNIYFQSMFQDEDACKFRGLGKVVTEDPSTGDCVFPVEVVRGHQNNLYDQASSTDRERVPLYAVFVLLLSILCEVF